MTDFCPCGTPVPVLLGLCWECQKEEALKRHAAVAALEVGDPCRVQIGRKLVAAVIAEKHASGAGAYVTIDGERTWRSYPNVFKATP